jgi:two-component system chemotaxis response regulator CheB
MNDARSERPARVVVVEDSLVQRAHLVAVLEADGDIAVVGQATTATEAIDLTARLSPDVMTLDLHLPDRSGHYVIEQIMAHTPTPILVLSASVDGPHCAAAIDALVAGALDALPKPARWTADRESELRRSVRTLRRVTVIRHIRGRNRPATVSPAPSGRPATAPVVALAASTGGPAALAEVLSGLGGLAAPVLVVQHIHSDFVAGLVSWMARVSALPVQLARHGQALLPGHVYIGPGGAHLRLDRCSRVALAASPATIHRPSANELFLSVAEHAGSAGVGVVLTGMGNDGARGLLAVRGRGGRTMAQDEASSAVFGMPQAASRLGAVEQILPLGDIAIAIARAVRGVRS